MVLRMKKAGYHHFLPLARLFPAGLFVTRLLHVSADFLGRIAKAAMPVRGPTGRRLSARVEDKES
jgi:hypothetical protein